MIDLQDDKSETRTPVDLGMIEISREQFDLLKSRHCAYLVARRDVVGECGHPDEYTYLKNSEFPMALLAACRVGGKESFFKSPGLSSRVSTGTSTDSVNHPPHYNASSIEPIDVIEAWKLGFCLGNTVKYIARAPHKGSEIEDLKKARWYLDRRIRQLETEIETEGSRNDGV